MIRSNLGMSVSQLGPPPREPVTVMMPIRSVASPATVAPTTVSIAPETNNAPQPYYGGPVNVLTPPAQVYVTQPAPALAPTDTSGTIIPGVPDEYTYIGGGIILFLVFGAMKRKR